LIRGHHGLGFLQNAVPFSVAAPESEEEMLHFLLGLLILAVILCIPAGRLLIGGLLALAAFAFGAVVLYVALQPAPSVKTVPTWPAATCRQFTPENTTPEAKKYCHFMTEEEFRNAPGPAPNQRVVYQEVAAPRDALPAVPPRRGGACFSNDAVPPLPAGAVPLTPRDMPCDPTINLSPDSDEIAARLVPYRNYLKPEARAAWIASLSPSDRAALWNWERARAYRRESEWFVPAAAGATGTGTPVSISFGTIDDTARAMPGYRVYQTAISYSGDGGLDSPRAAWARQLSAPDKRLLQQFLQQLTVRPSAPF
jgi:hypothetical protein